MRTVALPIACMALIALGCAGGQRQGAADPADGGRRAALALVSVQNLTPYDLTIAYRPALGPGGEVAVGEVEPGETRQVAPVPAEEPILLYARAAGRLLELPARTFENDETWTWTIPAGAPFRIPTEQEP